MFKRFLILGLVLVLTGSAVLASLLVEDSKRQQQAASYKLKYASEPDEYIEQYNKWLQLQPDERIQLTIECSEAEESKTPAQLHQQQHERLEADMDKLAAGQIEAHPFAEILYGGNWRQQVEEYKKQKERNEFIFTASVVCTSIGGTISVWCVLLLTVRLALKGLAQVQAFLAAVIRRHRKIIDEQVCESYAQLAELPTQVREKKQRKKIKRQTDVLEDSGRQDVEVTPQDQDEAVSESAATVTEDSCRTNKMCGSKKITMLLSGEESTESEDLSAPSIATKRAPSARANLRRKLDSAAKADVREMPVERKGSLEAQTENLEKQIAEFRQMAQSIQRTTLEHSKPINSTLKELTEQVSAIREYAAHQQERVEKLQDGYDWSIVRTFCLRIIRCLDNLDSRISQLTEQDVETAHLKEVRDELLFTLESSGLEKYEPELNSDYRGQEKYAEAIKERQPCDDPKKVGKVADIIRSGFQYFIDEENVRIVRTAQVKLFG